MTDMNTVPVSLIDQQQEISDFINEFARSKQESEASVIKTFELSGGCEISIHIDNEHKNIFGELALIRDSKHLVMAIKSEDYDDTDNVRLPETALKSRGVTKKFQRELEVLADVVNHLLGKYSDIFDLVTLKEA